MANYNVGKSSSGMLEGCHRTKMIQVQKLLQTEDMDFFTITEANLSVDLLKYYRFPGYTLYLLPKYRQVASGILTGVKEVLKSYYDLIKSVCSTYAKKSIPCGKTNHYQVFWSEHLEELKRKWDALRNTVDQTERTKKDQVCRRQSAVPSQAILPAKRTSFNKFISNINCQSDSQRTF
ncbi:unnamed protein product [Rodentolepis nana]|uniref:Endo/exonuclease/phosphatase domain-containing protein n=1 Tax=Rodentolepis nana TaxID=102285 RepID=A0A0R3T6K6_RODNA|nr:unnamed protein product [Rodentolepis nana]